MRARGAGKSTGGKLIHTWLLSLEMEEVAKQTLKHVGETMFPGISESYQSKKSLRPSPISKIGNEIVTDLPLQVLLYLSTYVRKPIPLHCIAAADVPLLQLVLLSFLVDYFHCHRLCQV